MKFLVKISLIITVFFSLSITFNNTSVADWTTTVSTNWTITVSTSEDLSSLLPKNDEGIWCDDKECKIPKGFTWVTLMMWSIIKYFTLIASLWAVLFIVINGILYSTAWVNDSAKTDAKNRIVKTLTGLILLLLSWLLLNIIAPWIYTF